MNVDGNGMTAIPVGEKSYGFCAPLRYSAVTEYGILKDDCKYVCLFFRYCEWCF